MFQIVSVFVLLKKQFVNLYNMFFVLVIFFSPFVVGKDKGVCHRTVWKADLQKQETEYYCCDDYEENNGTCIECKAGYTSLDGNKCGPCPDKNSYGIKCLSTCHCTGDQRCHHVAGCINLPTSTYQMTEEGYSSSALSSLITKIYNREIEDDNEQDTALLNQKIVIYTMCIAGLLIVITICYVCVKRLNSRRTRNGLRENSNTKREHEQNRQNGNRRALPSIVLSSNQINERRYESCYDEIDETKINETKTPLEKNGNASFELSSDNSESENDAKLEGDGYLNPYQPMVNDPDTHDYKTATASKPMENQLHNKQEIGYIDAMSSNRPIERKYLEIIDEPRVDCLKGKVITKPSNDLHMNIPKTSQYSRVVDVQKYHKHSASTLQLSSKTNPSEQKHVLNKRLSI